MDFKFIYHLSIIPFLAISTSALSCECLDKLPKIKNERGKLFLQGHCLSVAASEDATCPYEPKQAKEIFSNLYSKDSQDIYGKLAAQRMASLLIFGAQATDKDFETARQLLSKLCSEGFSPAYGDCGQYFYDGIGGKKEPKTGLSWLKKAIATGDERSVQFAKIRKIKL